MEALCTKVSRARPTEAADQWEGVKLISKKIFAQSGSCLSGCPKVLIFTNHSFLLLLRVARSADPQGWSLLDPATGRPIKYSHRLSLSSKLPFKKGPTMVWSTKNIHVCTPQKDPCIANIFKSASPGFVVLSS